MSATCATSYTWNPGGLTGANQTLSPATTQVYTVIGSNGTCTNSSTGSINVTTTPTVAVSNATTCSGVPIAVTASGATNYTFNPGALTGATQNLSPATTTTYIVTGANGSCTNAKSFTLTVVTNPTVGASASATLICASAQTTTLTGTGATSYVWNPGAIAGNNIPTTLTSGTTFTVTGTTNGCSNTATVAISVSPCTGIATIAGAGNFKVYPNPTQGAVTLNFGEMFSGQLSLFNSLGQLLSEQKINDSEKAELNLSVYPKGVYLIKLVPANGKARSIRIVRD
jgi:hypothetical protein